MAGHQQSSRFANGQGMVIQHKWTKQRGGRGLRVLQHNCTKGKQAVEVLLEMAMQKEVDIVMIQEPTTGRGSTARHDSFRWIKEEVGKPARCWTAVNKASGCRVTELREQTKESGNCIQVLQVIR